MGKDIVVGWGTRSLKQLRQPQDEGREPPSRKKYFSRVGGRLALGQLNTSSRSKHSILTETIISTEATDTV